MPGFIKPQLATLKSKAPQGEQWIHEIKYDGYRVQLHINAGKKRVFTTIPSPRMTSGSACIRSISSALSSGCVTVA